MVSKWGPLVCKTTGSVQLVILPYPIGPPLMALIHGGLFRVRRAICNQPLCDLLGLVYELIWEINHSIGYHHKRIITWSSITFLSFSSLKFRDFPNCIGSDVSDAVVLNCNKAASEWDLGLRSRTILYSNDEINQEILSATKILNSIAYSVTPFLQEHGNKNHQLFIIADRLPALPHSCCHLMVSSIIKFIKREMLANWVCCEKCVFTVL